MEFENFLNQQKGFLHTGTDINALASMRIFTSLSGNELHALKRKLRRT
jgi:hypothetical protein